jgi:acetyl-CoA carboxylase carboxyltransferase component
MATDTAIEPSKYHALQLKSGILNMLVQIDDEHNLSEIHDYLHYFLQNNDKNDIKLTPEQEAELDEGIAETYDPSKLTPHSEVMKMMKEW